MLFVHLSRTAGSQRAEFVSHSSLLQHSVLFNTETLLLDAWRAQAY